MKQPELGKCIAELRKAKGSTQEELVAKCNISVRTLQRIESGEVTPRSYTIKIIFAALDHKFFDLPNTSYKFIQTGLISKWLEQLYKYVIDLFNLKTNTMKKLLILSIPFLTVCTALIFSFSVKSKAQARLAVREKFETASSNSKFIQWFNSGQIDSIGLIYLENAYMMPDNYPDINNRKSIQEYYQKLYNQGLRFLALKTKNKFVSDTIAIDRGIWSVTIDSQVVASGTYLIQWRYSNGNWLIENEMSKSDNFFDEQAFK